MKNTVINEHCANYPSIPIDSLFIDQHVFVKRHVGQKLFRFLPEGLLAFRRIDLSQADFQGFVSCYKQSQRIAIMNAYDSPFKALGRYSIVSEQKEKHQYRVCEIFEHRSIDQPFQGVN